MGVEFVVRRIAVGILKDSELVRFMTRNRVGVWCMGKLSAADLRTIADKLDELNGGEK